jgi:hypothetical protein
MTARTVNYETGADTRWETMRFYRGQSREPFVTGWVGVEFSDRGEYEMKGFDDAVRLYEVRWRD